MLTFLCAYCGDLKARDDMVSYMGRSGRLVICHFCKKCRAVLKAGPNTEGYERASSGRARYKNDRQYGRMVREHNRGGRTCVDCGETLTESNCAQRSGRRNKARGTLHNRCRDCQRERKRASYERSGRDSYYRRRYGITLEERDAMLASQGGACAICGASEPRDSKGWQVDHDHNCCPERSRSCGRCIRGIVCRPCNTALGMMRDDPDLLQAAATYLLERRARPA